MTTLRITEIFHSLQGEGDTTGFPTVFVRLTGCPLRCNYCDTAYAFRGGEQVAIQDIYQQVLAFGVSYVTVTGGEPLAQKGVLFLLNQLCDAGLRVSLETSGALEIAEVDPRVIKVVDLKTPSSGEVSRNCYENISFLQRQDQVKFVIANREDYEWAKEMLGTYALASRCQVLFSPSHQVLAPSHLADWILADRLPVRFQVQLHKYIWGDVRGK